MRKLDRLMWTICSVCLAILPMGARDVDAVEIQLDRNEVSVVTIEGHQCLHVLKALPGLAELRVSSCIASMPIQVAGTPAQEYGRLKFDVMRGEETVVGAPLLDRRIGSYVASEEGVCRVDLTLCKVEENGQMWIDAILGDMENNSPDYQIEYMDDKNSGWIDIITSKTGEAAERSNSQARPQETGTEEGNDLGRGVITVYPNPFRNEVVLMGGDKEGLNGSVEYIAIYDIMGRMIRSWKVDSGNGGEIIWDGCDNAGQRTASGVYFCVFKRGQRTSRTKVVLLK